MNAGAACNAANCSVVEVLRATNETYAACGVPTRDQSATLLGVVASIGSLALLMVILRLVDRAVSAQAQLGWDDLLIALSGLVSIGMNMPVIVAARLGFGRDIWGIPPDNITESLKWLYVAYFMYMLAECLCQLSILAFYLRIMIDPKLRLIVWIFIGMVTGFGFGNVIAMVFQCTPISFFWDGWRREMEGFCGVDVRLFGFIRGAVEIFLDLAILSMPLPMLAKLNMSRKKKLQIMSMFCVGFVITIVSCLRLWSFVKFAQTQNATYDNTSGLYWCATESNLFTVVACMPAMHAIFHKFLRRFRESSTYASKGQYGDSSSKGSYFRQPSDKRQNSLQFGGIKKSTDVNVFRTERSSSDVDHAFQPGSRDFGERSEEQSAIRPFSQFGHDLQLKQFPRRIRMLQLHPLRTEDESERLEGTLRVVFLPQSSAAKRNDVQYAALSYVWGSSRSSKSQDAIRCNGVDIPITKNCRNALRRIRKLYGKIDIWVDSICIDQSDVEERSHQVTLMGDIYSQAETVIAWLDFEDCNPIYFFGLSFFHEAGSEASIKSWTEMSNSVTEGIEVFLAHDWFKPGWCFQELVLAPQPILLTRQHRVG
ncbi:heterokaryon incompatibility protein-domain-containing protein [Phaeosphaeriaceae sp. PMI808]|nr:heterokaryon incompatibility protein-domain-containing protein [Phaeosphaeriaceae sp. PMI808]